MGTDDFITLREYLEEKQKALGEVMLVRLDALNAVVDLRLASISEATKIYKETTDVRLAHMNEFREENQQNTSKFVTRDLYDSYIQQEREVHQKVDGKIASLEIDRGKVQGMATQRALMFTQIFTIIGIVIALLSLIVRYSG